MTSPRGLRVLLAGDHGELATLLRSAGHDVAAGPTRAAALGAAEAASHDVVILDPDGVDSDPFALARRLRAVAYAPKPLFVALSRDAGPQFEADCRDAGIDLLLIKPVEPRLLTGFLDRLSAVAADYTAFDPAI